MQHVSRLIKRILFVALLVTFSSPHAMAQNILAEFEQKMRLHSGKVIYLDFWASWCVPCRQSFPWLNAMQAAHQPEGFVVLSVNLDAKTSFAQAFLKKHPANFDIMYDSQGVLAKKFAVKGMPSSYLFNRQGEIIASHFGFNQQRQDIYQQQIIDALALSTP